jgi:hypothetical protein
LYRNLERVFYATSRNTNYLIWICGKFRKWKKNSKLMWNLCIKSISAPVSQKKTLSLRFEFCNFDKKQASSNSHFSWNLVDHSRNQAVKPVPSDYELPAISKRQHVRHNYNSQPKKNEDKNSFSIYFILFILNFVADKVLLEWPSKLPKLIIKNRWI